MGNELMQGQPSGVMNAAPTREQILALEQAMMGHAEAVFELPTTHHFAPGMYARELFIPAGMVLTGKTHRQAHLNMLVKGDITVWIDGGMRRVQAPVTFVSQPGTKRVGHAHTDTIWITVHATKETDLEKIEAEVIAPADTALSGDGVNEMEVLL